MSETNDYVAWVGREETATAPIAVSSVVAMAATLDDPLPPADGQPLPPGWHWLYFNPAVRRSGLGADGHPRRGGFLPPIELPRRMWAGSRISYRADCPVGSLASRRSRILKVENKTGRRGPLWFVTVGHTTSVDGLVCIEEEQDIVYRDAPPPEAAGAARSARHADEGRWQETVVPDTTLLFRFSALTFNGHRIHYDQAYARDIEGYPALVVHGPLTATLLQRFALRHGDGRRLQRFDFRGVSPLFVDRPFQLEGRPDGEGAMALWARGPDGELAMSASARFEA